jgi:hypothetical protein
MTDQKQSFWSSVPGILTGIAALITAMTGLYLALNGGNPGSPERENTQTRVTEEVAGIEPVTSENVSTVSSPQNKSLSSLVDCTHNAFQSPNTVESLMSWSDYYHTQIKAAGGVRGRALDACTQTITYRAQAHCKAEDRLDIRQSLFETLTLCRESGINLDDVLSK